MTARLKAVANMGSPILEQALAARLIPELAGLAHRQEVARRQRLVVLSSLLEDKLPGWRWREPDGGSSLWIDLPGADAGRFAVLALRNGVEVAPGYLMDSSGRHDSFIRLPIDLPTQDMQTLVDRLCQAWQVMPVESE